MQGQFVYVIRKRIKLEPQTALFLFINSKTLPPTGECSSLDFQSRLCTAHCNSGLDVSSVQGAQRRRCLFVHYLFVRINIRRAVRRGIRRIMSWRFLSHAVKPTNHPQLTVRSAFSVCETVILIRCVGAFDCSMLVLSRTIRVHSNQPNSLSKCPHEWYI